jgi:thymidylate kinase
VVVELCGLPGAGKTTLADAVVGTLRARGVEAEVGDRGVSAAVPRARRLLRKAAAASRVLLADPVDAARVARVLGGGQRSSRDAVALPAQWWVTQWLLREGRRRRTGVVVLEEGALQALWSAGLRSSRTSAAELVATAATSPVPDLVVHLDLPTRLAMRRMGARGSRHSRVQHVPDTEQPDLLQAGAVLLEELLDEWRGRGLSRVLVLDGTRPDCAAELATAIGGLIVPGPRREVDRP